LGDDITISGKTPPELVDMLRSGMYVVHLRDDMYAPTEIPILLPIRPEEDGYVVLIHIQNASHLGLIKSVRHSNYVHEWVAQHSRFHLECHAWPLFDEAELFDRAQEGDDLRLCISYWGCSAIFTNHTAHTQGSFPGSIFILSGDSEGNMLVLDCRVRSQYSMEDDYATRERELEYKRAKQITVYGVTQLLDGGGDGTRYFMWRGRRVKLDVTEAEVEKLHRMFTSRDSRHPMAPLKMSPPQVNRSEAAASASASAPRSISLTWTLNMDQLFPQGDWLAAKREFCLTLNRNIYC